MHINANGMGFNARDSTKDIFRYMYDICKATKCDNCVFRTGEWIQYEDGNIRCEMAYIKEAIKQRMKHNGNNNDG